MLLSALVEANNSKWCVFDKEKPLKYKKLNTYTIIGHNDLFFSCFVKNHCYGNDAFAGRKFDLQMEDGEIVNCSGQWWDALNDAIVNFVGATVNNPIITFSANDIENLKKCYVFFGCYILRNTYIDLIKSYHGKVYKYYEYKKYLKYCEHEEKKAKFMLDKILANQNH